MSDTPLPATVTTSLSWIEQQRFKSGLCHLCGNKIYVVNSQKPHPANSDTPFNGNLKPMTIKGSVRNGRCLLCYPLNEDTLSPTKKRTKYETSCHPDSIPTPSTRSHLQDNLDTKPFPRKVNGEQKPGVTNDDKPTTGPQTAPIADIARSRATPIPQLTAYPTTALIECTEIFSPYAKKTPSSKVNTESDTSSQSKPPKPSNTKTNNMDNIDPIPFSIKDRIGQRYEGVITKGTKVKGFGKFKLNTEGGWVNVYEGEFTNGVFHGKGKLSERNNTVVYMGSFKDGGSHGHGSCNFENGEEYVGEWFQDKRHGFGVSRNLIDDTEMYAGEWQFDGWHGQGTLVFPNGSGTYQGGFRAQKLEGEGCFLFSDGSVYRGQYKDDKRDGKGAMLYPGGTRYEGEWKENWRSGDGALHYPNSDVFQGKFSNDKQHGEGCLSRFEGSKEKQTWIDGKLSQDI